MNSLTTLDTLVLFSGVMKKAKVDCVYDIGSRDGVQSVFFRDLLPEAHVAAFEANPENYALIMAKHLENRGIQVYPYAVSNINGVATFHIADPASDPHAVGSSSLLAGGYPLKEKIEVPARRIDDFTLEHFPDARRLGLWIDVESAEYEVLEGISKIKDRVLVIQAETAIKPVRQDQKTLEELVALMKSFGFTPCGANIGHKNSGDVVFINDQAKSLMGLSYGLCFLRARVSAYLPLARLAVFFKKNFYPLYYLLRRIFIKLT